MKSNSNSKPRSTTSPKTKKNVGKERDKEKGERRKSENQVNPLDPSQLVAFLMGESPEAEQYARLSRDSVLNYADQSIYEHVPHEVSHSLAEDFSYKLRNIIHNAQIKANLSGRTALMGEDIEACFNDLGIEKVYGANNNANFMPLTDKHLYLDDSIVNLVELAETTSTVIQPGDVVVTKECYPEATSSMKNYVRYFDTMCRALICTTPKLQQEALRDVRRNTRIGPIVNWFYHFGYFLLSKDITYVSLTLSALRLIEALEGNTIARQLVGEKELKLLLRLILQRLLRTRTDYEVIKPTCAALATLCRRAPLRDLVINKISQRRQEFNTAHALPLVCIINALGVDALEPFIDHLLALCRVAKEEGAKDLDLLADALLISYRELSRHDALTPQTRWEFYEIFEDSVIPFFPHKCGCPAATYEVNWRNVKAQLLKSRRNVIPLVKKWHVPSVAAVERKEDVDVDLDENGFVIIDKKPLLKFGNASYAKLKSDALVERSEARTNGEQKPQFITIGRAHNLYCKEMKKTKALNYLYMVL